MIKTLDSGLTVAIERMPGVASASFDILLPGGSAADPADRTGLTSVLVEMLLRGAGPRDARELTEAFDALGLDRSVDYNDEYVALSGSLLSRDLARALEIFRDVMVEPRLDSEELPPSIELCTQQVLSIEDYPVEKLFVELAKQYYPYPWGRPSKGVVDEIERVSVEDVRASAAKFSSRGAVIALAGDIDETEGVAMVERIFGSWKGGEGARVPETRPPETGSDHVAKEGAQVQIGMAWPGLPPTHPDYPKGQLLVSILSGGMSGRLFVEVREKRGLVYSVRASYGLHRHRGDYFVYAGTTPERAAETIAVIDGELDRVKSGVEAQELAKAKTQVKSSVVMSQESTRSRAISMAADWHRLGMVRTRDEILAPYDAVTLDEMNAWLAELSREGGRTLTLGPDWRGGAGNASGAKGSAS